MHMQVKDIWSVLCEIMLCNLPEAAQKYGFGQ